MKDIKQVKTVAVHDGSFHADDVFAVAILQLINSKIEVIRTRDEKNLKKVDMRVDVGMKYDEKTFDFDHHQENSQIRENGIPYAAVGLIWKHFWKYLVRTEDEYKALDDKLIQGIDADDNGIKTFTKKEVSPYTLYYLISTMNPHWKDKTVEGAFDKAFIKAVRFAKQILRRELKIVKAQKEAIKILQAAANKSKGKYIILEKSVPWKGFIIEKTDFDFVIYKNSINNNWYAQGVPISKESFELRKSFPSSWSGLRDKELAKLTGVPDVVFAHKNNFLVVCKSKGGAIELVKQALKE